MQGRRHDFDSTVWDLEPGDYGKDESGMWFCRPPLEECGTGGLRKHTVVEHEDGTITVSPSILFYDKTDPAMQRVSWHGYLERGVWREV